MLSHIPPTNITPDASKLTCITNRGLNTFNTGSKKWNQIDAYVLGRGEAPELLADVRHAFGIRNRPQEGEEEQKERNAITSGAHPLGRTAADASSAAFTLLWPKNLHLHIPPALSTHRADLDHH